MTAFFWIVGVVLFLLAMSWLNKLNILAQNRNRELRERQVGDVIEADFKALDEIAQGKRWVGAEAEIVCARYPYRHEFGFRQELLCRTKKNAWFVVAYEMVGTDIERRAVHQSDEKTARFWLESDRAVYTKYFDLPETA